MQDIRPESRRVDIVTTLRVSSRRRCDADRGVRETLETSRPVGLPGRGRCRGRSRRDCHGPGQHFPSALRDGITAKGISSSIAARQSGLLVGARRPIRSGNRGGPAAVSRRLPERRLSGQQLPPLYCRKSRLRARRPFLRRRCPLPQQRLSRFANSRAIFSLFFCPPFSNFSIDQRSAEWPRLQCAGGRRAGLVAQEMVTTTVIQ